MDTDSLAKDWSAVPENIQVIRRFPKPHKDLFELAEKIPYWWQLAQSAPALAFMVARCWSFDGAPKSSSSERIKRYLLLKRTGICAAMGFPANKRTVRLLSRLHLSPEEQTPYLNADLKVLRMLLRWEPSSYEILEDEEYISERDICKLATGSHMSRDCLWTFRKNHFWFSLHKCEWFFKLPLPKRMFLTERFAHAARHYDRFPVHRHFLEDLTPLFRLRGYKKATAYLHDYSLKLDAIEDAHTKQNYPHSWPMPPIEPTELISPISSCAELQREGEEMDHCIYGYNSQVFQGTYYAYRIDGPWRCTIGITFDRGSWKIDQVKGPRNEAVIDPEVMGLINEWLATSSCLKVQQPPQLDYLMAISKSCSLPLRRYSKRQ